MMLKQFNLKKMRQKKASCGQDAVWGNWRERSQDSYDSHPLVLIDCKITKC